MSKKPKDNSIEATIRRRVEKRFKQRSEYFSHVVAFVLINGAAWLIFPQIMGGFSTICAGISVLWSIAFLIDTIQFVMNELKERTIQQEIERERMLRYGVDMSEKAKNRLMYLTDDGEIMEFEEDEEAGESLKLDNRRN